MEHNVIKHSNHSMNLENDMRWIKSNHGELLSSLYGLSYRKAYDALNLEDKFRIPAQESFDMQRAARKKVEELGVPQVSFDEMEDSFQGFTPGEFLDLRLYYTLKLLQELAKQEGIMLSDARGEKPVEDVYQEVEEHLMKEEIPDKIEKAVFYKIEREYEAKTRLEKDMRWVNKVLGSCEPIEIDSKFYPLVCSTSLLDIQEIMRNENYWKKDSFDNDEFAVTIPAVDKFHRDNLWLYRCVQTMTTLAQRLDVPIENADSTERRPLAEIFEDSKKAMKRKHLNVSDVLKDIKTRDESKRKDALSDAFSPDNELRSGITTEATKTVIADVLPEPEKEEKGKV